MQVSNQCLFIYFFALPFHSVGNIGEKNTKVFYFLKKWTLHTFTILETMVTKSWNHVNNMYIVAKLYKTYLRKIDMNHETTI
jgi:hypothetical protein